MHDSNLLSGCFLVSNQFHDAHTGFVDVFRVRASLRQTVGFLDGDVFEEDILHRQPRSARDLEGRAAGKFAADGDE